MHRATVLTTVVAIAPVALAIVAMTSESWREGLGFSVGILLTFLVLLEFEPARHPRSTGLAVVFSFLVWIICAALALNPVAFFGAAMLSGVLIPQLRRRPLLWIMCLGLVIALIGGLYFLTEPLTWTNLVRYVLIPGGLSVFAAAVILMMHSYWKILRDLEVAQEAEAELGIMRERMRFASDLHDIQGHTLHVVNLKIALAEELVTRDPERAMTELREVYTQVEETIRETKNLAYARRRLNLRAELENARNLLEAAGVAVRIARHGEVADGLNELLGQVLRETTTNILRHADSSHVTITISETGIEIINDGAGPGPLPSLNGLETLRARVANEGGALTVARSQGEFRTAVQFPRVRAAPEESSRS
ncbi:hypothetical protein GCM10009672_20960 [Nesterenkonia lutea]